MSATNIQVHCRLDFIFESNTMKSDQTAPWSDLYLVFIVFNVGYLRTKADERSR